MRILLPRCSGAGFLRAGGRALSGILRLPAESDRDIFGAPAPRAPLRAVMPGSCRRRSPRRTARSRRLRCRAWGVRRAWALGCCMAAPRSRLSQCAAAPTARMPGLALSAGLRMLPLRVVSAIAPRHTSTWTHEGIGPPGWSVTCTVGESCALAADDLAWDVRGPSVLAIYALGGVAAPAAFRIWRSRSVSSPCHEPSQRSCTMYSCRTCQMRLRDSPASPNSSSPSPSASAGAPSQEDSPELPAAFTQTIPRATASSRTLRGLLG